MSCAETAEAIDLPLVL